MAMEIGADVDGMVVYEWESFYRGSWFLTVLTRRAQTIWLNRKGERFCDEGIPVMAEAANAIGRQPGKAFYALFDENNKNKMVNDELAPFEAFFLKNEAKEKASASFAAQVEIDLKEAVAADGAIISDSLDDIARWMGVEPEILKANVGEYNSFCDSGRDAWFAKERHLLMPLRQPPYYALKCGVDLTNTHGGIRINERMEALTKETEPIPGLYAAGVETGAKDWDSYNMWLSGHAFGFTINSGRIAGEEAARYAAGR
jgi:fumarate reductase flavoprotein subunit